MNYFLIRIKIAASVLGFSLFILQSVQAEDKWYPFGDPKRNCPNCEPCCGSPSTVPFDNSPFDPEKSAKPFKFGQPNLPNNFDRSGNFPGNFAQPGR
jgi:hypothetical protein